MTNSDEIKFRSQQIVGALRGPPLLMESRNSIQDGNTNNTNKNSSNNKRSETARGLIPEPPHLENKGSSENSNSNNNNKAPTVKVDSATLSWGLRIDVTLIPRLPMYYVLEPTSVTLQDLPVAVVESRISDFLRLHSISYSFHADSVCLDCTSTSLLKFTVQFWLVQPEQQQQQGGEAVTLELQRRQGSVIEMQQIRRKMIQFIMTGEQSNVADGQPKHLPRVVLAEVDKLYDPEEARKDAVQICLQMLESKSVDQIKLGLESLMMLTNPSVVSREDAVAISQEVIFQTSDVGRRLKAALAHCFGIASTGRPMMADDDMMEYIRGAYFEQVHNIGLKILSNALELAIEDGTSDGASTFDLASEFWSLVARDLFYNVERAVQRPHEGSTSVRCMRLLGILKGQIEATPPVPAPAQSSYNRPVAFRSCLAQAHQYGKRCHLSLEMESQKLLAMDIDHVLVSH